MLGKEGTVSPWSFLAECSSHLPFNFLVGVMLGAFQLTISGSDFRWVVLSSGGSPSNFILCALI